MESAPQSRGFERAKISCLAEIWPALWVGHTIVIAGSANSVQLVDKATAIDRGLLGPSRDVI